jgi:YHS domain-containing protein
MSRGNALKLRFASIVLSAATFAGGFATAARAQDRLYATPMLTGAYPFLPSEISQRRLPVALRGFSAVALRDQRQWLPGEPQWQLVFDGQLYWFAGPRDRNIFAAAPHEYAPVLAGDCIVTYVDAAQRTPGRLEYGLIHRGRMYFFAGEDERARFQADPALYTDGDLANGGRCLVSQVDQHKSIIGLPATVAIVNGLRYLFAGDYQRRQFAADPAYYGVQRILADAPEETASPRVNEDRNTRGSTQTAGPQSSADNLEDADDQDYAMEGYCPVSIHEQGAWRRGSFQNHVDHEGHRYVFAGENERKLFLDDPQKYVPVLAGNCIVSKLDKGNAVRGSVYHSLIYEGRLYLFAGPDEVKSFKADPRRYVEPAAPAEAGEFPITDPTDESTPTDEPPVEGNVLREGRSELGRRGIGR